MPWGSNRGLGYKERRMATIALFALIEINTYISSKQPGTTNNSRQKSPTSKLGLPLIVN